MDDSSTASDEIVYKGNPNRRGVSQETEWKYRGRSGSEAGSTEPLSAPAGMNAQLSEGFQRFYKAVVSPTHVRVTAGGRIVPNTRGPSSPTAKRAKDKAPTDSQNTNGQQPAPAPASAQGQAEGALATKGPRMPSFAMPPHYYPPFAAQYPHLGATMPMMPVSMGIGGFPFPQAPFHCAANAPSVSDGPSKEAKKAGESKTTRPLEPGKADNKVKISPPEQFDHTKPFTYNGQLLYPVPAAFPPHMGAHYMPPPGFVGPPGYPVPGYPNPMIAPHMGMSSMMAQMGFASQAPSAIPVPAGNRNPSHNGQPSSLKPPSAPPISSIRPSDISSKQINYLRHSLKYHEDQLQYNRHQIDEKEMERTIKMLQEQIERFEHMNQAQIRFENENYPRREKPREGTESAFSKSSQSENTDPARPGCSNVGSQRKKDGTRVRPGINTSQNSQATYSFVPMEPRAKLIDPVKKSTLPSGAALAPPFEPRTSGGLDQGGMEDSIDESVFSKDTQESVERRLLAAAASSWTGWSPSTLSNGTHDGTYDGTYDGTHDGTADQRLSSQSTGSMGRPYLVGTLPTGLTSQTAQDADYVYERELTEDELRARFLYWGRAPRFARSGLPKYDGKDFYPPSPIKVTTQSGPSPRALAGGSDVGRPVADAANLFRPTTPVNGRLPSKRLMSNENMPPVRSTAS